jgi:hypothetical protein
MNTDDFVNIRLGCDNAIFHNLNFEFLPDIITISYVDIDGLLSFINTENGKKIINSVLDNKLKLVIYPTDSLCLSGEQYHNLCDNLDFISNPNVTFYQSWYNEFLNFNLYCGSHIHRALYTFIFRNENKNIDLHKKEKYFLTLNNRWNLAREELYNFYQSLTDDDKNKFHSSFNFKDLFLGDIKDTDDLYGDNVIEFYDNSLMEIITESHYDSITEKSYKPLIAGMPFIYWSIDDNYKVKDNYSDQISYFKLLDIDVNYFNINYNNRENTENKIKELLSLSTEELLEIYNLAFEKAKQNKVKIINYLLDVESKIKK